MKLYHRVTISLTDSDIEMLEDLRKEGMDSYSQIFRRALDIYYRLFKAFKTAGYDMEKIPKDFVRLAFHIYNVELRQYVIMDREIYRVLLKKIQEKFSPEEIEKDEDFLRGIRGFANLFYVWHKWKEDAKSAEKAEEVLKTIEFGGGGEFTKVKEGEFIFRTVAENVVVTKSIIKTLFDQLNIKASFEISGERIFIKTS
ncbi:MAG: ribbon-helix-helix protein, CopG family [Archaeoglobaceae archaeon]